MSSSENAFTKQLRPETTADKVEGLLEHFNLPPAVIAFIRRNLRLIQIGLGIVVVIVVTVSLYSSYRERMIQDAASALSSAMNQQGDAETAALQKVVTDYSATKAAVWAKIELAHLAMKKNDFSQAAQQYENILKELDTGNPSYPLVLFGLAQAYEADKKYDAAAAQYDKLKEITGYTQLGYAALGRIAEAQGDIEKAIATYNNYLLTVGDDPARKSAVEEFTKQIARLKTQQ
jgi:predicted negative regulator of RcsB-dependent stress response